MKVALALKYLRIRGLYQQNCSNVIKAMVVIRDHKVKN